MAQQLPPPPSAAPVLAGPTNTLAIVSLASGIVSWFLAPIVGGVVAVVTGHLAKAEIRRTGEQGNSFATIGLVLGYLHLAVVVLVLGLLFLLVLGAAAWIGISVRKG